MGYIKDNIPATFKQNAEELRLYKNKLIYYQSGAAIPAVTVVSVAAIGDITVAYGTAFGSIGLPATVQVVLSNATTPTVAITWSPGSYSGTSTATHPLTGTLTVPEGVEATVLTAAVNVIVPVHPLSVFDRIWSFANDADADFNSNASALGGRLYGTAEKPAQGAATTAPALSGSAPNKYFAFDGTNDHLIQDTDAPAMSNGFEVWLLMDIKSTSGTRSIWAGGGSVDIRIISGNWQIRQGTAQSVGAAATGKKLYRFVFNSASSFVTINKIDTRTVAATTGTTLPSSDFDSIFGANSAVSANWTQMDLFAHGIKSAPMTTAQANAIFDYLGYAA